MNKTVVVRIGLAILAILAWGNALYQYFFGSGEEELWDDAGPVKKIAIQDSTIVQNSGDHLFVYDAKFKDPFKPEFYIPKKKVAPKPVQKPKSKPAPKPKPKPPVLQLTGLFQDKRGMMAMIENQKREVFFVLEKDSVEKVLITQILKDSVAFVFNKEKYWLELKQ